MENLQELSNQLDNIKEKLTDKEYKDLMELTQKIHNIKKDKRVKVIEIKIQVLAFTKYECGNTRIHNIGHWGYEHDNNEQNDDDDDDEIKNLISICVDTPNLQINKVELKIIDFKSDRHSIDVEEGYIEEPFYLKLKECKYIRYGNDLLYLFLEDVN